LLVVSGCAGAALLFWCTSFFVRHGLTDTPTHLLVAPRPVLAWSVERAPPPIEPVDLHAVWTNASGEAFAVGERGTILHRTSGAWSKEPSPTTEDLHALAAGSGSVLLYAVGGRGTILALSRDAHAWSIEKSPTEEDLYAVAASPKGFVAVGAGGTILQRSDDTHAWTALEARTTVDLRGIAGWVPTPVTATSAAAVATFVVGDRGTILVRKIPFGRGPGESTAWASQDGHTSENLLAATFQGNDVIVVGAHGTVLRGDLASDAPWSEYPSPVAALLRDVKLVTTGSSTRLLVVGEGGVFEQLFREDTTWRNSLDLRGLRALDADSPSVVAVGKGASIVVATIPLLDE
jgi:photosystem II stability/assembly factor-like uncharacterized protein